jgi:hypothetical protein
VVGEIPLYFYVPIFPCKEILMGWIRKIQKHKEEKDKSGKFKKTRRKEWRKEKEQIFIYLEVPILVCSPLVGDALELPPSCNPPSGEIRLRYGFLCSICFIYMVFLVLWPQT